MVDEDALINRLHTLFGAHEWIPYVIRRADGTASLGKRVRLGRALAAVREFSSQTTATSLDEEGHSPHIEFSAGTSAILQIYPGVNDTAALVLFAEPYHLWSSSKAYIGRWTKQHVGRSDQEALLTAFFRREYALLRQSLEPTPQPPEVEEDYEDTPLRWEDEGGSVPREKYWAQIKEYRGKRGEAPELSNAEKELSPQDCLELWDREGRLSSEYQHRQSVLRGHRIGRLIGSAAALIGLGAITLQYLDYLPEKFLGYSRTEQRGHYLAFIVLGGIFALISHLDLRALILGTPWARKQAQIAKRAVGGVFWVATIAFVALLIAAFWSDLTNSGFLPAIVGVGLAMLTAFLGVFYFQYRHKDVEIKQAIESAAWMGLAPFGAAVFAVFQLFLTTLLIGLIAMATGAAGLEASIRNNFLAVMIVMATIMVVASGVKYIHGRYRARSWEGRLSTLSSSATFVVLGFPLITFGVLLVVAGVKTFVLG